jgi:hypothetical protein
MMIGSANATAKIALADGTIVAGHAIWTAVAGATIGLALLLRSRERRLAYALGASGLMIVTLDHIRHNYGIRATGLLADALEWLGAGGWMMIYLLIGLIVAVIVADAWVIHRSSPRPSRHEAPPLGSDLETLRRAWRFRRAQRALAVATYQAHRAADVEIDLSATDAGPLAELIRHEVLLRRLERDRQGRSA